MMVDPRELEASRLRLADTDGDGRTGGITGLYALDQATMTERPRKARGGRIGAMRCEGIGRATALRLAREGADVAVNYLDDPQAAEAAAKEIRDQDRARPEKARRKRGGPACGPGPAWRPWPARRASSQA